MRALYQHENLYTLVKIKLKEFETERVRMKRKPGVRESLNG